MSAEMWADIPTYEGHYEISFCGTVREIGTQRPARLLLSVIQVGTDEERESALEACDEHSEIAAQFARSRVETPSGTTKVDPTICNPQNANEGSL